MLRESGMVVLALFLIATTLAIVLPLTIAAELYVQTREGVDFRCSTDSSAPTGALVTEDQPVTGRIALWPLGRTCEWKMETGGTVVTDSGWSLTWRALFASVAVVVALASGVSILRSRIRSSSRRA